MTDETRSIEAVVDDYVRGMVAADEAALRRAFDARASVIGRFQGRLLWDSLDDFIVALKEMADGSGAEPRYVVRALQVEGDAAAVHVEDELAGMRFHDFLSLAREDGRWRIVAKVFHQSG